MADTAQLQFTVANQTIERTDSFVVVEDSEQYLYAKFTFTTDDWDGLEITAVFIDADGEAYPSLCTDGVCQVPHAWLANEQKGAVGVLGTDGNIKITTRTATVQVYTKGYDGEAADEDETKSYFDQLMAAFSAAMESTSADAASAAESAKDASEEAASAAASAKSASEDAASAAKDASSAAKDASSAADSSILSKSWATGSTGTRSGENTDNSRYYAEQAKKDAESAAETLDIAGIIVGQYKIGVTADGVPYIEEVSIDPALYGVETLAEELDAAIITANTAADTATSQAASAASSATAASGSAADAGISAAKAATEAGSAAEKVSAQLVDDVTEQAKAAAASAADAASSADASAASATESASSATESAGYAAQSKEYRGGYSFGVEDETPYLQEEE